jgi:membrane-associated phospholipid phosphatase
MTEAAAIDERTKAADAAESRASMTPVDRFCIAYLGLTSLVLVTDAANPRSLLLLSLHLLGIGLLLGARRLGLHRVAAGEWVLALYPVPLFAFLYTEVGYLDRLLHPGAFFDADIQHIETLVFGGFPSSDLHQRLSSRVLGEYLHVGYGSYYFLAPALVLALWFKGRRYEFDTAIATISLAFFVSFLIFILYPVAGPYHTLPRPPVESLGFVMPEAVRYVIDRGSSIGAAFPSSHVAVAVTVWIMAIRFHGGLSIVYAFLVPALAVGAVYGGFHYATDIVAGALLGVGVGTVGFALTRSVSRRARRVS